MKYLAHIKIKNEENKKKIFDYLSSYDNEVKFEKSINYIIEDYAFDKIYIDELSSLGNTMYQIITKIILICNSKNNKTIIFIKENLEISLLSKNLSFQKLEIIAELERSNINSRLEKSKIKIRKKLEKNSSIKLGRKKKSVFDKHKTKIFKYLESGFSKVMILKKLKTIDSNLEGKTIQSLTAYIKRMIEIKEKPLNKNHTITTPKRDIYD